MDAQRFTSGYGSGVDGLVVFVYALLTALVLLSVVLAVKGDALAGAFGIVAWVGLGAYFTVLLRRRIRRGR